MMAEIYKSKVTIEKEKSNREAEIGSLEAGTYILTNEGSLAKIIAKGGEGPFANYTDIVYAKGGNIIGIKNDTIVRVVDVDIKIREG